MMIERVPLSPPLINAIDNSLPRPIWSVMVPTYNCSSYLSEVLNSVLIQDMGEEIMQIEVIDDASTDADVKNLVEKIGKGRISYFCQSNNVGSLRNFETCINRSKGKFIHLLHGDDRVKPGFYKKMNGLFEKFPEAGAAFCNYSFINELGEISKDFTMAEKEDGILENWLIRIAEFQKIQYASMVVRREVYEKLGSYFGMSYGEDWEMWVRIAKHYPVAHTPTILAEYRGRPGSLTWEKSISGEIIDNMISTIHYIQNHLPIKDRAYVLGKSRNHCANILMGMAISVWMLTKDFCSSQNLIFHSLTLNKNFNIFFRIAKFYLNVGIYRITGKTFIR